MGRKTGYRRNAAREAELRALIDEGVREGAEVMAEAVRARFEARSLGFTSANFATGDAADIQVSPVYGRKGRRRCDVFTDAQRHAGTNAPFPYPAAWEFGHFNIFTRQFERVETFGPALIEHADQVGGVMARLIRLGVARQHGQLTRRSGRIEMSVAPSDFGL
jgi:hypothetical protein